MGECVNSVIRLTGIPMVPSMNNCYPSNRFGRRFKSKEFKDWERHFDHWALAHYLSVHEARSKFYPPAPRMMIDIRCEYYFHWDTIFSKNDSPKQLDTSNRLKILHDAIAGLILLDDKYFFDGSFTKRPTLEKYEFAVVELKWLPMPLKPKNILTP